MESPHSFCAARTSASVTGDEPSNSASFCPRPASSLLTRPTAAPPTTAPRTAPGGRIMTASPHRPAGWPTATAACGATAAVLTAKDKEAEPRASIAGI
eukprot:2069587-Prymnesium_polylepis.1